MTDHSRIPPNLQAVADAAGVHRSTASRALNPATRHLVAGDVAGRIVETARRLGYRRDALAASLRTGRSRLVGVIVPDIANPVFGPILRGIESALAASGYSALLVNAGQGEAEQMRLVEELMERRVDGLILATARQNDPVLGACLSAGTPTVLVNRAEESQRASAVVSDDRAGIVLAVRHLASLGHRRIGHLAGPQDLSTGALRRAGFIAGVEELGIGAADAWVAASAYTREAGEIAALELMARYDVTAIAAANDLLALGAYRACASRGLVCPRDMSIVGHNDMPLVDMVEPPLTTIRISHLRMGEEAARLLVREIEAPGSLPERIVTEPELVLRASTAAPRQG
ncbi:MAG: Alanine racemase [Hyphomicrobiales bacterium]|nr:Alanine racemase [Hyphomicrobiales bacterium]